MGQKDLAEKYLENFPDVFADTVNALVYKGQVVLKEGTLQPAPTETLYHSETEKLRNQFHDISKYVVENGTIAEQYTLENETKINNRMVLRKAGYEGAVYREQLEKNNIYPVIGLVLYWGRKRWRAPRSIHQLFGGYLKKKPIRNYIDNHKIHVYEMAHLSKEVRERFQSDMRIIVDYLAEGGDYIPTEQKIKHLEALLLMLESLTGDTRYGEMIVDALEQEKKGGAITMCELIDKYEKRGMELGKELGIRQGTENSILTLLEELGAVPEDLEQTVMNQTDNTVLLKWLKAAARAESMEDFRKRMV